MTNQTTEFRALLEEAESGSHAASAQIFEEFGKHILRAVRRSLHSRLRQLFDSQDLVQSVWKSFVENRDALDNFETPQELIAFLTTIAQRKVAYKVRRHLGKVQKRDENRVSSLQEAEIDPPSSETTPDEIASLREQWFQIVNGLDSRDLKIVESRRDGLSNREISSALGVSERTIQRVLSRISKNHAEN